MLSVMIRPEADTAAADWTHMKAQSTNLETDTFGLKQVFKKTKQNKKNRAIFTESHLDLLEHLLPIHFSEVVKKNLNSKNSKPP